MSPPETRFRRPALVLIGLALLCNGWSWQRLIPAESLLNNEANEILLWVLAAGLLSLALILLKWPLALLKNLKPLAFSLAFFVSLFLGVDMGLGYLELIRPSDEIIENVHIPDDQLGWRPKPNSAGRHRSEGFDVTYVLDEHGFKAVEQSGRPELRLFFFGDSYTFGHGVTNEDTFPNIIAAKYVTPPVHVYNTAVMGHGIVQMYQRFLLTLDQIQPGDLVIFTPLARDLERNLEDFMFPSQFVFNQGFLKVDRYPYYDGGQIKTAELRSPLNKFKTLLFNARFTGPNFYLLYRLLARPDTTAEALAMLESARQLTEQKGAKFSLFFLPRRSEAEHRRYDADISAFAYHDLMAYFPAQNEAVAAIGLAHDSHWNRLGHELAAIAVVDTLSREQLIPAQYWRYRSEAAAISLAGQVQIERVGRRQSGDTLSLYVVWAALAQPAQDYTAFVQLLDEAGRRVAGVDLQPERPFTGLAPGQKLVTFYDLPLPAQPGRYTILLGLYYFEAGAPVNLGAGTLPEPVLVGSP
jgi:hypothetical protein